MRLDALRIQVVSVEANKPVHHLPNNRLERFDCNGMKGTCVCARHLGCDKSQCC